MNEIGHKMYGIMGPTTKKYRFFGYDEEDTKTRFAAISSDVLGAKVTWSKLQDKGYTCEHVLITLIK